MNVQDFIVYGIIALAVVGIILRIKRNFSSSGSNKDQGSCPDCPLYSQCTPAKKEKKERDRNCTAQPKVSGKSSCCK